MALVRVDITYPVRKAFDVLDEELSGQSYDDEDIVRLALRMAMMSSCKLKNTFCTEHSAMSVKQALLGNNATESFTTSSDEWISTVIISQLAPDLSDVIHSFLDDNTYLSGVGDIIFKYSTGRNLYVTVDLDIQSK